MFWFIFAILIVIYILLFIKSHRERKILCRPAGKNEQYFEQNKNNCFCFSKLINMKPDIFVISLPIILVLYNCRKMDFSVMSWDSINQSGLFSCSVVLGNKTYCLLLFRHIHCFIDIINAFKMLYMLTINPRSFVLILIFILMLYYFICCLWRIVVNEIQVQDPIHFGQGTKWVLRTKYRTKSILILIVQQLSKLRLLVDVTARSDMSSESLCPHAEFSPLVSSKRSQTAL